MISSVGKKSTIYKSSSITPWTNIMLLFHFHKTGLAMSQLDWIQQGLAVGTVDHAFMRQPLYIHSHDHQLHPVLDAVNLPCYTMDIMYPYFSTKKQPLWNCLPEQGYF
jgi:hypothetical protein